MSTTDATNIVGPPVESIQEVHRISPTAALIRTTFDLMAGSTTMPVIVVAGELFYAPVPITQGGYIISIMVEIERFRHRVDAAVSHYEILIRYEGEEDVALGFATELSQMLGLWYAEEQRLATSAD